MTTIERIARAIVRSRHRTCCVGRDFSNYTLSPFDIADARAALQALRQVDEGTVEAMVREADELHSGCGPMVESATELHGLMFTAAIDHILSQGGEGRA